MGGVNIRDFVVMVGIPGSGKSTEAQRLKESYRNSHPKYDGFGRSDVVDIVSSDEVRKILLNDENDQTQNEAVFKEVHRLIKESLYSHHHIIVDATNITYKSRKGIMECLNCLVQKDRVHYNVVAYVIPTQENICKEQNKKRDRVVPDFVIEKQIKQFEIPFYEEGFDEIYIRGWEEYYNRAYVIDENKIEVGNDDTVDKIVKLMNDFDQRNHHHKYDLGTHCKKLAEEICRRTDDEILYRAALIHDIGKLYTGEPKDDGSGEYRYYSHHNVGTYTLLANIDCIAFENWKDTMDLLFYVNFHMQPFSWEGEKAKNKWKKIFGEKKYNNLILFNKCDKIASGTERKTL